MTFQYDRDQADSLREKILDEIKETTGTYPSRSEVHKKRRKQKRKMKYPLLRFLTFLFILVPIVVLILTYYFEQKRLHPSGVNPSDYDAVIIEHHKGNTEKPADQPNSMVDDVDKEGEEKNNSEETKSESEQKEDHTSLQNKRDDGAEGEMTDESGRVITHVVQPNETLYKISMKYYQTREGEQLIRKWNNLQGNEIYVGQVLKIPLDNERHAN